MSKLVKKKKKKWGGRREKRTAKGVGVRNVTCNPFQDLSKFALK